MSEQTRRSATHTFGAVKLRGVDALNKT